ncbi:MAG: tetratricopeptide repeat protein, partial [Flavobacteriaceae bacterium]|nr:tetratricopeptide repeat protein [Flavobacteriaceae bacterium]
NKLTLAERFLDDIYELEPKNDEVFIQKANILSKQDQHLKAIDCLKIALDLTNDPADVYSLLGMEYLFLDDFYKAKDHFIKCLEIDDQDYASLYNVMYCFDYLELYKEAIQFLNKFLDKNPYSEIAWHQIGKQYYALGEYKKSLTAFDFAIISDDLFIGAYLEKGKTLEKLDRFAEAIESYAITLELDDPTSFALLRMGICYERLGHTKTAGKYFHQTIKEDPLLDKGWVAIINYYLNLKDSNKALYYINKALEVDNQNISYWKQYALVNHALDFFEEAEIGLRKMLNLGNYELETWTKRADILQVLGEYEAAIDNLEEAQEFYPDNAEIIFRLAGLHYMLKENEAAQRYLRNGLKIDPEFVIIIEELFPNIFKQEIVQDIITKY